MISIFQSQQWKHQNNVWNVFKVTTIISLMLTLNRFHTLFWCFHCWIWSSIFHLGSFIWVHSVLQWVLTISCSECFSQVFKKISMESLNFSKVTSIYLKLLSLLKTDSVIVVSFSKQRKNKIYKKNIPKKILSEIFPPTTCGA